MRRLSKLILLTIVAMMMISLLMAQSVIKDRNGKPIPYIGSSWTAQTVACSADTVWTKVTIPTGTFEMLLNPSAAIKIAPDSLYAASNNYETALLDTTATIVLPTHNMTTFWIRRNAAGTAASLRMLFKKW